MLQSRWTLGQMELGQMRMSVARQTWLRLERMTETTVVMRSEVQHL